MFKNFKLCITYYDPAVIFIEDRTSPEGHLVIPLSIYLHENKVQFRLLLSQINGKSVIKDDL